MHADVGRGAGNAAARGIESPVVVRSEQQPVLKERTAGQMHRAEVACGYTRRELSKEGKEAVVLADRGLAPAQLRKLGELLGSFEIAGERLFTDDVFSDAKSLPHERRVQIVGRRDVHDVDSGIAERQ